MAEQTFRTSNAAFDFGTELALGMVPGAEAVFGMGERRSMGTTVSGEDMWRGNELTPAPTSHTTIPTPAPAGEQMAVVSESVNDTALGSGARTVMVHYISATGEDLEEIVTLNGTTPVNLQADDVRFVNDMHVESAGGGIVTAGHVKIHNSADAGLVYSMIALGENKAMVPHYMVPAGKKMVIRSWDSSEAKDKRCAFRIQSTSIHGNTLPGIFLIKGSSYVKGNPTAHICMDVAVPEFAIVKITAWPDAVGAEGSCFWRGKSVV